jgi:hypothetical protein
VPYPYTDISFEQLRELSETSNIKSPLGHRQHELLQYFVDHPGTTAYEISPVRKKGQKQRDYRNTKNQIRRLHELKLIEKINKKISTHEANYYRLGLCGIYYLILNNKVSYDIAKALLRNYGNNCLFHFFLYPYVDQSSLLQITESSIISIIFNYLRECFQKIEYYTRFYIDRICNQNDGILTHQLFVWNNISKTEYDTKKLVDFLKHKFQWDWIRLDKVQKTEDHISIFNAGNHAQIRLNNEKTKAILTFNRKKMYEFIVREDTVDEPIIDIYDLMIGNRSIITTVKESAAKGFLIYYNLRILDLIRSIASSYTRGSSTAEILSKDERFTEILEKTKRHFDETFKLI